MRILNRKVENKVKLGEEIRTLLKDTERYQRRIHIRRAKNQELFRIQGQLSQEEIKRLVHQNINKIYKPKLGGRKAKLGKRKKRKTRQVY
jgi:sRNA-binding carbon storage regulator CsrA